MLSREDCERFEQALHKEIAERHARGGYSPDAATLEFLCRVAFELVRHVREKLPAHKPAKSTQEK